MASNFSVLRFFAASLICFDRASHNISFDSFWQSTWLNFKIWTNLMFEIPCLPLVLWAPLSDRGEKFTFLGRTHCHHVEAWSPPVIRSVPMDVSVHDNTYPKSACVSSGISANSPCSANLSTSFAVVAHTSLVHTSTEVPFGQLISP